MGRIVGVVCDGCGAADVEVSETSAYLLEDKFPRNNWLSIDQWEDEGVAGNRTIHICSPECLLAFAKKYAEPEQEKYGHKHE